MLNGLHEPESEYRISAVTMGECLRGAILHPRNETLARLAAMVEEMEDHTILPYGKTEAMVFSRISVRVTARRRIPDLMIAATAIVAGLPLATYDAGLKAIADDIGASGDVDLVVRMLEA